MYTMNLVLVAALTLSSYTQSAQSVTTVQPQAVLAESVRITSDDSVRITSQGSVRITGSDTDSVRITMAGSVRITSGSVRITGSKIFISGGEQDMTENIVHFVRARLPDAPAGTKGLSLFIVLRAGKPDCRAQVMTASPHGTSRCRSIEAGHNMFVS